MKDFWRIVFAVIVGMFLYGMLMWGIWLMFFINVSLMNKINQTKVEPNSVLVIKLNQPVKDKVSIVPAFKSLLQNEQPVGLNDIIKSIQYASTDSRIKGILLDTRAIVADWAQLEEIRKALEDFKSSGKFLYAYSDMYMHRNYYLSSIADSIFITPNGVFMWTGLSTDVLFYKKLLDKLGIEAILIRHGKYKSAAEPFIRENISEPNREQLQLLLDRLWDGIVEDVAKARGKEPAYLDSLADNLSIRLSSDAVKYGLVDREIYYDQLIDRIKADLGVSSDKKIKSVSLREYYQDIKEPLSIKSKNQIAVVFAQGNIVDQSTGIGNEEIVGRKLAKLLRKLRENNRVKAVVLRVNSPGGSALASEEIWREVELTKQYKPIIISMGGVAASGGYYISCAANKIVADKFTITGSIGVFGLFLNAEKLLEDKIGITQSVIKTNKNADLNPFLHSLNADQKSYIETQIDNVYNVFLRRVADGRGMTVAEVDSIAQGRVWSAVDARKIGLVDTLAGLQTAISMAAQEAGLIEYDVVEYPKPKTFLELLLNPQSAAQSLFRNDSRLYGELRKVEALLNQSGIMALFPYSLDIH